MTARENALRIIRFDHPERITQGPPAYLLRYHGCDHEGFEGGGHDCPVGSRWTDIWGTEWHKEQEGCMGFPRGHPIPERNRLRGYRWPDPNDERVCGKIYDLAADFPNGDVFLAGAHRDTLWEKAYMLVGMENMMASFYTDAGFAREVLRRIMDFQIGIAEHYLNLGVELVFLGDDLGTQIGPLLNPSIVEDFLVPEYERLFALYRDRGVLISFHSCGKIDWAIEMFIRLGVNLLNPIQATANDLDLVRSLTQGKMALQGGVSTRTIMEGPVERIASEVKQRIRQLGTDGGYFCSPDQGLPFPQAHVEAFNQAVERYGRYPIAA